MSNAISMRSSYLPAIITPFNSKPRKHYLEMPKYSSLVRIIAETGAAIGCLIGAITIFGGLAAFQFGIMTGISAISGGAYLVLASLAGFGIVYCFLSVVQAQIATCNAVVAYTMRSNMPSAPVNAD